MIFTCATPPPPDSGRVLRMVLMCVCSYVYTWLQGKNWPVPATTAILVLVILLFLPPQFSEGGVATWLESLVPDNLSKLFHTLSPDQIFHFDPSPKAGKKKLHNKGFDELFTVLSVNVLITCPFTLYKIKFTCDEPGRWLMTGCGMNSTGYCYWLSLWPLSLSKEVSCT